MSSTVVPKSFTNCEANRQSSAVAKEHWYAYLGNDALMYLDWKVHEGEHALLKYGRPRGDGMAFVARESEFHVDNVEVLGVGIRM